MDIIKLAILLSIIQIVLELVWQLITFPLFFIPISMSKKRKTLVLKTVKFMLLAFLTGYFVIFWANNSFWYILLGGFYLLNGCIDNAHGSRKAISQMPEWDRIEYEGIQKYNGLFTFGTLIVYAFTIMFPILINNILLKWIYNSFLCLLGLPVIGFLLNIIGFSFFLIAVYQTIMYLVMLTSVMRLLNKAISTRNGTSIQD